MKCTPEYNKQIRIKIMSALIEQQVVVDYTTTTFPPLTSIEKINKQKYYGPLPESNKVVDGIFAGAFPGDSRDFLNRINLINVLNAGVTKFVCLQEEYPDGDKPSAARPEVRPYFRDVQKIMADKENHKELISTVTNVTFEHLPIKDMNVTADYMVLKLAKKLVEFYHRGEVLYIHCWGGHGRTGVVVCLMLHLMYGLTADEAMTYCEHVHKIRQSATYATSPQTKEQMDQVRRIVSKYRLNKSLTNYVR